MYESIRQIVMETELNNLKTSLDNFSFNPKLDLWQAILFESNLRKIFAREINNCVLKIDDIIFA